VPQQSNPMPRPQPQATSRAAAPAPRRQEEPHDPVSEYAKRSPAPRPAPQGLDPHGRQAPVHNPVDEDHLEIPAFLRRQAN
jgi:cell division protein FtsZ